MITALVHAEGSVNALAVTLAALVPAVADGLVGDAVVLAPAGRAEMERVADAVGAAFLIIPNGSDPWRAGAGLARRDWLLCLAAGDVPSEGWIRALDRFVAAAPTGRFGRLSRPASVGGRLVAAVRNRIAAGPHAGDLVHRSLLTGARRPGRPAAVAARIERDPVFG